MSKYSNSPLVVYTKLSPNHSGQRTMPIDRISPHCVVGQCSVETLGELFAKPSRKASCQYSIGSDGRVAMHVEEKNRSWCTSSSDNDQRAITIECASDTMHPPAKSEITGSFAPQGIKGAIIAVALRSLSLRMVLQAITPGIAHPVPTTKGMTDLPERPTFLKIGSSTTVARAM